MRNQSLSTIVIGLFLAAIGVAAPNTGDEDAQLRVNAQAPAQKRQSLTPPRRMVQVDRVEIRLLKGSSSFGVGFGIGVGNASGGGAGSEGEITISNTEDFAQGIGGVLITSLQESKGFRVLDRKALDAGQGPAPGQDDTESPNPLSTEAPEAVLRVMVVDMSCRRRSGGLTIGGLSGGQGQYENKVTMDVRLVDPTTNLVLDTVTAVGRKTSRNSLFGTAQKQTSYWDPDTKTLDLSYADFEDSALAEATRLAIQDAVDKFIAKAQKRPWEARVTNIVRDETEPELYLNVTSESGLAKGDILELYQVGDVLKDEATGKVTGRKKPKSLGKVIVSFVDEERVVCIPAGAILPAPDQTAQLVVCQR